MNNIILPLILILTRFISLLPRSSFNGKNSYLWKFLGGFLKRRKSIINANIDHCFGDLSEFEKSQLKDNIWNEDYHVVHHHHLSVKLAQSKIVPTPFRKNQT